jgi:hypothetical protein
VAERVSGDARGGLGDAFDEPEQRDRGPQHGGDEDGEERIDDLGAEVGDEADDAQRADVGVETAQAAECCGAPACHQWGFDM